jgi:hypothetical protein
VGDEGVADDAVRLECHHRTEAFRRLGMQAGATHGVAQCQVDLGIGRRQHGGAQQAGDRLAALAQRKLGFATVKVVPAIGLPRLRRAQLERGQGLARPIQLEQAQADLKAGAQVVGVEPRGPAHGFDAAVQVAHSIARRGQGRPSGRQPSVRADRAFQIGGRIAPTTVLQMHACALQALAGVAAVVWCLDAHARLSQCPGGHRL